MFTGIVECACRVAAASPGDGGLVLELDLGPLRAGPRGVQPLGAPGPSASDAPAGPAGSAPRLAPLVRIGDSVAVNGCCLTVAVLVGDVARFDVVAETLGRTNLGRLTPGAHVNVERSLRYGDALDGHLVQGHVERTGEILALERSPSEVRMTVACGEDFARRTLPKGSVAVDGVSLTVAELGRDRFTLALVPHTLAVTTLGERRPGDALNLEPDMIGQWVLRAAQASRA